MSPPYKKSRKEPSPSWCPFSCLPYEMAMNCLARVPKTDIDGLSLVSKRYRSLFAWPELYRIRSVEGCTETYLYVCLRTPPDPNPRWYLLGRRKSRDTSDLIPIPSLPCQSQEGSSVVALDSGIYVIGGLIKGNPTSDVWRLECRTYTWRHLPSMGVARASAAAAVVDGKIYVLGGCKFDDYSLNWGEVYDPKTQTWDSLPPMPDRNKLNELIHGCVVRDRKVFAVDGSERTFYYSPSKGKWGIGNRGELTGKRRDWCMIDNLLYCCSKLGIIFWCEKEELDWRKGKPEGMHWSKEVMGLEALNGKLSSSRLVHCGEQLVDLLPGARLSTFGRNMVLFWDEIVGDSLQIWCAEISLERRQGGQIWGNIEWSHAIMTYASGVDRFKGSKPRPGHSKNTLMVNASFITGLTYVGKTEDPLVIVKCSVDLDGLRGSC